MSTSPTQPQEASADWQPIPESWVREGTTRCRPATGERCYYAVAVRVRGADLDVKFVRPDYGHAVTRSFEAADTVAGTVPAAVARVGPEVFGAVRALPNGSDDAAVTVTDRDRRVCAARYPGAVVSA